MREVHNHELMLLQRQEYFREKVRSRKMLLGSVIASDAYWDRETTMYPYRRRNKNWVVRAVTSTDSGCSMSEGSGSSWKQSETEEIDLPTIVADVAPVVRRRVPFQCQKCRRVRRETRDASSQHSNPPSDESAPPSPRTEIIERLGILPVANVLSPPPPDRMYQCRVIREKDTIGTAFYPVYRLYLEIDRKPETLLLVARKRKKCGTSKYVILTEDDDLTRKSSSVVGKLRSNLVGTRFYLSAYGGVARGSETTKNDSCLLYYETNILGTKGPRRMKVFLPENEKAVPGQMNLLERYRRQSMEGVLQLVNKEPEWDRETLSHVLYFDGRVTKSSVKNFQLCLPPDETVLLQFGKIGRNEFTLDFQNPLNAVQAFAIALSSFDYKIACE